MIALTVPANAVLSPMIDNQRFRDIRQVRDEHLEIVDVIAADRPAQAERVARRHVPSARRAIEQPFHQKAFVPHWVVEREGNAASPQGESS